MAVWEIVFVGGILLIPLVLVTYTGRPDRRVMRPHKGLELSAKDGRLTHVRETYSEREV